MLKHLILVGDLDELRVILSLLICDKSQIRISFLTVFANCKRIVQTVLLEEFLGVIVAVDVNLGKGIINSGVLRTGFQSTFEKRKEQLESVAAFDFSNQLVDRNLSLNRHQEVFDN